MDLKTWRANRQVTLQLPSGLTVVLRRVNLIDVVATGKLPAPLLGLVQDLVDEADKGVKPNLELADLPQYGELVEIVVQAAIVDPPIFNEAELEALLAEGIDAEAQVRVRQRYADSHLQVADLSWDDRTEIFNCVSKGAKEIAPFSKQSGDGQNAVDREPGVHDPPVGDPGAGQAG